MTENDYLNPIAIKEQCDAAISRLERDNTALDIVECSLDAFINDEEIKSVAYDALKQQINDYKTLLQAMREANNVDMLDFTMLKSYVGDEVLDGSNILTQKKAALNAKNNDENMAELYEGYAMSASYPWMSWYYSDKANEYWHMADIDQQLYNAWQEKEDRYDEIEINTKELFQGGTLLRQAAQRGLESISGVFQNKTYVPDMNAEWRNIFTDEYKMEWYTQELLDIGYTQGEIDSLISKGIILTSADIEKIKESLLTEKIYVSDDTKALIYNGKVYSIYVPTPYMQTIEPVWVTDGVIERSKMEFEWEDGVLKVEPEEIPKEEIRTTDYTYILQNSDISSTDPNAMVAVGLHLLMGIQNFAISSLNHTEVIIEFQSAGDARRTIISVGDSRTRQKFANINYNMPVNTYREQEGIIGYRYASDIAERIYECVTGEEAPVSNGAYTIIATLDERHRDTSISGYLSYNSEGQLIYTPLIYSGDTASIATCDKFTGLNTYEILNITEYLSTPEGVDQVTREVFEKALEGSSDESN